jgi:hypothetical protein
MQHFHLEAYNAVCSLVKTALSHKFRKLSSGNLVSRSIPVRVILKVKIVACLKLLLKHRCEI